MRRACVDRAARCHTQAILTADNAPLGFLCGLYGQAARPTTTHPVPPVLSSLLHRTRVSILILLLVVLPLQSVAQLVAGIQGHRHLNTGTVAATHDGFALASLAQPLRAVLDRLHAAQDPRLQMQAAAWAASRGPADGWHEHGGVRHRHSHDTADVIDVGDAGDDSMQAGATAFLAWLPRALAVPVDAGSVRPAMAELAWRDRVVAPPLTPPRG